LDAATILVRSSVLRKSRKFPTAIALPLSMRACAFKVAPLTATFNLAQYDVKGLEMPFERNVAYSNLCYTFFALKGLINQKLTI
jgi:uncharacterized membrane protein